MPVSHSDESIQKLRDRWGALDANSVDFSISPFGLTDEGLKDFRGLVVKGQKDSIYTFRKQRFENCDLTYAQFVNCEIIDSIFVGTKLVEVNFHSCRVASSPTPNCKIDRNIPYQPPKLDTFAQDVRRLSRMSREHLLKPSKLELLDDSDFERAAIFCMSLNSVPSQIAFSILSEQFNLFDDEVPLIVVNQDDFSPRITGEGELIMMLFGVQPRGLGEVAWARNRKIVKSDILAKLPIREIAVQRLQLLTSKVPKSTEEMSEETFWQIIENCRPKTFRFSTEAHTARISEVLTNLTDEEILGFSRFKDNLTDQAYTWELSDAARTIGSQQTSDDDFIDFRVNLIFQGRDAFYDALRDPDTHLLRLEDAKLLLEQKFDFACMDLTERVSDVTRNLVGKEPGGIAGPDEPEHFRANFPNLYARYWSHERDAIQNDVYEASSLIESIINHNHNFLRRLLHKRSNLIRVRGINGRLPLDVAIAAGDPIAQLALIRANAPSDSNKIDLETLLVDCLQAISNGYYCASWLDDIEFYAWDVIMHKGTLPGDPECVFWDPNDEFASDLIWLSEQVQRWPVYRDEIATIPLDEWIPIFQKWKQNRNLNRD